MAFYVEKEDEWYIATDLETKVASQGKTAAEACNNLEEALELYMDGEKDSRGEGHEDNDLIDAMFGVKEVNDE